MNLHRDHNTFFYFNTNPILSSQRLILLVLEKMIPIIIFSYKIILMIIMIKQLFKNHLLIKYPPYTSPLFLQNLYLPIWQTIMSIQLISNSTIIFNQFNKKIKL